jgi:hypothetical protein
MSAEGGAVFVQMMIQIVEPLFAIVRIVVLISIAIQIIVAAVGRYARAMCHCVREANVKKAAKADRPLAREPASI